MKTKHLLFIAIALFSFGLNQAFGQWNVYKCDVLPADMPDSMWVKSDFTEGINDGELAVFTFVMDDPDIPGNKMIKIEELAGDARESWAAFFNADATVGHTVVWRTKPSDGFVELAAAGAPTDAYRYSYISPRDGAINENFRWDYPGTIVIRNTNSEPTPLASVDWQIFRLTMKNGVVSLYVNEDPVAVISGTNTKTTSDNFLKLGDNSNGDRHGGLYDWIIWDMSGAYAPGEGTALPADLTGLPGGGTSTADLRASENLSAYPNPFTGTTTIAYRVETTSMTSIDIYDVTGKLVRHLYNDVQVAGNHEIQLNAQGMPAGMYFCHARCGNSVSVVKMLLR